MSLATKTAVQLMERFEADVPSRLVVSRTFLNIVAVETEQPQGISRACTDSALMNLAGGTLVDYEFSRLGAHERTLWKETPDERNDGPSDSEDTLDGVRRKLSDSERSVSTAGGSAASSIASRAARRDRPDRRTTLMLRNIPNNYTRSAFLDMLNGHGFEGLMDFMYYPVDFSRGCGLGYGFVNLIDSAIVPQFIRSFDGFCDWTLPSSKVCKVSYSDRDQGLKANVRRYRNSPVMHPSVSAEFKPMLFENGRPKAFPKPSRALCRPCRKA